MLLLHLYRYPPARYGQEGFFTYPPILESGLLDTFSELSYDFIDKGEFFVILNPHFWNKVL